MYDTDFSGAMLWETDLRETHGLTAEQVLSSKLGAGVKLPQDVASDPRVKKRVDEAEAEAVDFDRYR